jgi:ACR3 family arsenite efflux pump ArsB
MWKLMGKISKNLIIAIPVMMILGFLFGILFDAGFLKGLIIPFTFLMVYPMMVTLNIQKVFEGGDAKAQVLTQIINFGIIPFIAWVAGLIFFKDQPYMALGLLLAGLVPTSGMTISWTGFAKGNIAAAVKMTVIGLTIGSIATPFYVQFLMGTSIEINFTKIMQQIVIIVFAPMIAGFLTRKHLIKKYGAKAFKKKYWSQISWFIHTWCNRNRVYRNGVKSKRNCPVSWNAFLYINPPCDHICNKLCFKQHCG